MNTTSLVIPAFLASAGVMLCSGAQALAMRFLARQRPLHAFYALMCFCAAGYQFSTAAYYLAETVPAAVTALHWQTASICGLSVAFFGFVALYTGQRHVAPWLAVVVAISAAMLCADLLSPFSLRFQSVALAPPLHLPWGEELGHVAGVSLVVNRAGLFGPTLAISLWALHRAALQYETGERRMALFLGSCVILLIATGMWGSLIDTGAVRSFYVAGFGFIGLVLLMSVTLNRAQQQTLADLRAERDRLQDARLRLESSEFRLRLVLKGTNDGWWDWNMVTNEHTYSARGWEALGYACDELPYDDRLWDLLVHPDDREYGQRTLREAIDNGSENYSFEMRMRHRDGHAVPMLCRGYILRDSSGKAIRVSGTDTDLTDRKQASLALKAERELNEQIFANSPIGIAIFDLEGNCVSANEAMARQVGGTVAQLRAQNMHQLASWKSAGVYELAIQTLATGEASAAVFKVSSSFGKDVWLHMNFRMLPGGEDNADRGRLMLMTDDLTEFKRAELERQDIQDTYERVFANSIDGILHTKPDGTTLKANPAACQMLGMDEAELLRLGRAGVMDMSDPRCAALLEQRARTGRMRGEVTMVRANGERFQAEISSSLYPNRDGELLGSTIFRDITERKQAEADTHRLAYFDELTRLPNRRLLLDRIGLSLESARRSGQIGALLFLDLDNFKRLNDARGHSIGDSLLMEVARRLTQLLRSADLVARLGGDEFVVLVDNLGSEIEPAARAAMAVAEKVRAVLERPFLIDGTLYSGTGSIGLTMFPKAREGVDDLLREADTAMYRAKAMGRNRIAYYESAMQAEVEERLALEQDLKEALETEQISVCVQPQVNAIGREIGGELLLRWTHPERGAVSPAFFIPIAEESGLILQLGARVLRTACETLARMDAAGSPLSLSVNISPRQFRQDDFVEQMRALLSDTGAPPSRLILEVTEGLLIEDWEGVASRMAELAALGMRFSIDDFGTGYSSLSYLKKLPLHEIKIDKSFVQNTPDDANDRAIVRSILAVARAFRLHVVAEGVETQAQANFLLDLECDCLQGFLFARPMPLEAWLAPHLAVLAG
jgi:diguanylate cyclase (GGDEF)-like protein/PAS domain S-box-containing protein